ncbi:unnamed protein product [Pylaiella littoralis]
MADLWKRFIAEALGMAVVISIGNGAIANEVLKKTKGHGLGLGFVAIAYGMAFFVAISMFGHISANVNPAMLFAKALLGRLSWKDALVLSVANIFGGFLGGVIVYGLYFAHFSIVPGRPSPPHWDDPFVESTYAPPSHTRNAYISYEPRHRSLKDEERRKVVFRYNAKGVSRADGAIAPNGAERSDSPNLARSKSVQVATILHEHEKAGDPFYNTTTEGDEKLDTESHDVPAPKVAFAETQHADQAQSTSQGLTRVMASSPTEVLRLRLSSDQAFRACVVQEEKTQSALDLGAMKQREFGGVRLHEASLLSSGSSWCFPLRFGLSWRIPGKERAELERLELIAQLERDGITKEDVAVYRGMLVADQNAKLAAFASRPAVLNYTANTVAEMIGTFSLIWFALMLEERVNFSDTPDTADNLMPILGPLLIGFLVVGLVTAMAGPTGYAANPARDLGPRIAHFVLPIPNKGPSEWYYSFVPILGPLLGGFIAAAVFHGCTRLNDYPDWFEGETNTFGGSWNL